MAPAALTASRPSPDATDTAGKDPGRLAGRARAWLLSAWVWSGAVAGGVVTDRGRGGVVDLDADAAATCV